MTTAILIVAALALVTFLVYCGSTKKRQRPLKTMANEAPAKPQARSAVSAPPQLQLTEAPAETDYLKQRLRSVVDLLFSDTPVDHDAPVRSTGWAVKRPDVLREAVGQMGSSAEFGTVAQLQRLLSDSNFAAGQVSKFIATDPVLSGKVLRLANSSAFGVSGRVDSIGHALMLIGTSNIVNHLCFDAVTRAFSDRTVLRGHTVASLWQHATATSVCALFVGYLFPEINKGKLYTMALLHDLGKFVMGGLPPLSTASASGEVTDVLTEEELYGTNHALVGTMLLENWQIPDSIAKPVELHHDPSSVSMKDLGVTVEKLQSTVALYVANQIAKVFTSADDQIPPVPPLHPSYRKLLDRQQLEQNIISSPLTTEVRKALALTQHFASPARGRLPETAQPIAAGRV